MLGSEGSNPRCIALSGTIGEQVMCTIYENRSSVCRDFDASWVHGKPNERCDKARIAWGLSPLDPDAWNNPDDFDKAA